VPPGWPLPAELADADEPADVGDDVVPAVGFSSPLRPAVVHRPSRGTATLSVCRADSLWSTNFWPVGRPDGFGCLGVNVVAEGFNLGSPAGSDSFSLLRPIPPYPVGLQAHRYRDAVWLRL
jgi:hypothetical protein